MSSQIGSNNILTTFSTFVVLHATCTEMQQSVTLLFWAHKFYCHNSISSYFCCCNTFRLRAFCRQLNVACALLATKLCTKINVAPPGKRYCCAVAVAITTNNNNSDCHNCVWHKLNCYALAVAAVDC
ncbi:unnamed protein product [Ceratitis capitata]|uniref:(Mediterranean fruit fly) hypothetical protein n=1 Tax=Ceratitis capitata TaxID=7213 RepID=A0A811VE31_CERCA|nr:unnamed protein product [Ceratitis capitata]